MNPFVWRFMGGFATSVAINAMIPDYYKHIATGANVAIWGKASLRGRSAEAVGRGVVKSGKFAGRTLVKMGPRLFVRVGTRFVPILGWSLLAVDLVAFMLNNPDYVRHMSEQHRELTEQGPYYLGRDIKFDFPSIS